MKQITTKDNSISYYNEDVQDYYHTQSGAREEAFEKHAKALNIQNRSTIYDMFFGLGYNSAAALDIIKEATIYCFENDKEILKKILEINADFKSYAIIKEFIKNFLTNNQTTYKKDNITLIMLFGDARELITKPEQKADYIFFDPFSPAKVPELWTVEFFTKIKQKMNIGAKLSTYSYARTVRENLEETGFTLQKGPVVGRHSPSTIAIN